MRTLLVTGCLALSLGIAPTAFADEESQTNTGVLDSGPPAPPLTAQQELQYAEKSGTVEAAAADLRLQEATDTFTEVTLAPTCPGGEVCPRAPNNYGIPAAEDMTIHSQNKSYTCGPASLRNMVLVMNRVRHGEYTAPPEASLEDWLGTTPEGTWIEDIVRVLNSRYDNYGTWKTTNPSDRQAYLASVISDTYKYKQPLIQGVRTDKLPYFNGKRLNHFNTVYGYNRSRDTTMIKILEEWDPRKIYGVTPSYGNPYGFRSVSLANAFIANDISGNGLRRLIV